MSLWPFKKTNYQSRFQKPSAEKVSAWKFFLTTLLGSSIISLLVSSYIQRNVLIEERKWKLVSSFGDSYGELYICAKNVDSQLMNLIYLIDGHPENMPSNEILDSPFQKLNYCSSKALTLSLLMTGLRESSASAECLHDTLENLAGSLKFKIGKALERAKTDKNSLVLETANDMNEFRKSWRYCANELKISAKKIAEKLQSFVPIQ